MLMCGLDEDCFSCCQKEAFMKNWGFTASRFWSTVFETELIPAPELILTNLVQTYMLWPCTINSGRSTAKLVRSFVDHARVHIKLVFSSSMYMVTHPEDCDTLKLSGLWVQTSKPFTHLVSCIAELSLPCHVGYHCNRVLMPCIYRPGVNWQAAGSRRSSVLSHIEWDYQHWPQRPLGPCLPWKQPGQSSWLQKPGCPVSHSLHWLIHPAQKQR